MARADGASVSATLPPMPPTEPVPGVESLKLKDPKAFPLYRQGHVSVVDLRDITIGKAQYGADIRLPGMKYAVIARPPVIGGKLVSFDAAEAMKVPGVEKVMEVQGMAVAVKIPAARRRRRDRAQHRRGDQGARRAEDRLG